MLQKQEIKAIPKLLKCLGWQHQEAGGRYPADEMSFRSTTYGNYYSVRGFRIGVQDGKIIFIYDPAQVSRDTRDETGIFPTYGDWCDHVHQREPHHNVVLPVYYDLEEIKAAFTNKLSHTLLVARKTKTENGQKYYWYEEAFLMKEIRTDMIAPMIEEGALAIDFDARTRHNHGTKFRIRKQQLHRLFTEFAKME